MKLNYFLSFMLILTCISCENKNANPYLEQNTAAIDSFVQHNSAIPQKTETINEKWLADDTLIINQLINPVSKLKPEYESFAEYHPGFGKCEHLPPYMCGASDLGFELSISKDVFYGGYGSYHIEIVHYKQHILLLKIGIYFPSKNLEFIKKYILQNIEFPVTVESNNSLIYKVIYPEKSGSTSMKQA